MQKFLLRVFIFFFPLLLLVFAFELIVRDMPNDYKNKYNYLSQNAETIEALVLGGCHGFFSIHPDMFSEMNTYNAAYLSQTLDYDYDILSKFLGRMKHLKLVMISLSYHSLYTRLHMSKDFGWKTKNYKLYYDNDRPVKWRYKFEFLSVHSSKKLLNSFKEIRNYYYFDENSHILAAPNGFRRKYDFKKYDAFEELGEDAANRHKNDTFNILQDNIQLLCKIVQMLTKNNIRVILFTPPGWKSYLKHLQHDLIVESNLAVQKLASEHNLVEYRSFLSHPSFVMKDFYEPDLLNFDGARKFTELFKKTFQIN